MSAAPVPFLDIPGITDAVRDELELAWKAVSAHGRFAGGPEIAEFEARFAEYCENDFCVGVANGTDALELVLAAAGIGAGAVLLWFVAPLLYRNELEADT